MEKEELIKLIMERIYTRRIYAEELADDILRSFNTLAKHEICQCVASSYPPLMDEALPQHDVQRIATHQSSKAT